MSRKKLSIDNAFPARLRELIEEVLFISQAKFAKRVGISEGYLSYILSHQRGPSADLIAGIAIHYGQFLRWLLSGEGKPINRTKDIEEIVSDLAELAVTATSGESQRPAHLEEPQVQYNPVPNIADILEKTRRILNSGNPVALDTIARNIDFFAHSIESESRQKQMEKRLEALEKAIRAAAVERIRVGDPPAKKAELVKRRVLTAIMKGAGNNNPGSPTTPD